MFKLLRKKQRKVLQKFFDDFEWIHICIGITGNILFFIGSILFLNKSLMTIGTYLFITGTFLMLIGSIGNGLVRYLENKKQ